MCGTLMEVSDRGSPPTSEGQPGAGSWGDNLVVKELLCKSMDKSSDP